MSDEFASRYEPGESLDISETPLHSDTRDVHEADPFDFEIIAHRLRTITEEQSEKLREVSGSPIVTEVNDFNIAITDEKGDAVSISPYILTHAGVIDLMVKWTLEHRDGNPGINPGDMFICNDPWVGALHQNDAAVLAPVFHEGELFAWTTTTLHQVDLGGSDPGGFSINADDVYDEPEPTPPLKIVDGGEIQSDIEDIFRRRSREPELFELDLRAQVAANNTAKERIAELIERYDATTVKGVMRGVLDRAEAKLRNRVESLPDGTWWQTGYQEGNKAGDRGVYATSLELEKRGDTLHFTVGGDSQTGMINSTYSGLRGGIMNTVLPLLCHDIPWALGGLYRVLTVEAAEGTIPNATFPGAVSGASINAAWLVRDLANITIAELLDASEEQANRLLAGCTGSWPSVIMQGSQNGEPFVNGVFDAQAGGWGARNDGDGIDTAGIISTPKGRIANVETNELTMPILYLFRQEMADSGGPGEFRGGLGGEAAWIPHGTDVEISYLLSTFGQFLPQSLGVSGGYPGGTSGYQLLRDSDIHTQLSEEGLPSRDAVLDLGDATTVGPKETASQTHSDIFYVHWPGGGGYGDPLSRDPQRILQDVERGAVSKEAARQRYGVIIDNGALDEAATQTRRAEIRANRTSHSDDEQTATDGADPLQCGDLGHNLATRDGDIHCAGCDTQLAAATTQSLKANMAVSRRPAAELWVGTPVGPEGEPEIVEYACPDCGVLFSVEVSVVDEPIRGPR
jgi:N-methylhydantoinase B